MTTLKSLDEVLVAMVTGAISQLEHSSESPPKIVFGLGLELETVVSEGRLDRVDIEKL